MTHRLLSRVIVVILAGFADSAANILRSMPSDPQAMIDQVIGMIQTESRESLPRQAHLRQDSREVFPIHLAIQVRAQP